MEKLKKHIVIIGGGISGLTLLHYLSIRYYFREDIDIILLEKEPEVGGTIASVTKNDCCFELGPQGFLNNNTHTNTLIHELNLDQNIRHAVPANKKRFVSIHNKLHEFPDNPHALLQSSILGPIAKLRLFCEWFVPKGHCTEETVQEFAQRRFGKTVADRLFDPMVSGIFAGNAATLHLASAFPKLHEMEQTHGSLLKAMLEKQKTNTNTKPELTSFEYGMQELTHHLKKRHSSKILCDEDVLMISKQKEQFICYTATKQYRADELYVCTPAYAAAQILTGVNFPLATDLKKITYTPVSVINLVYEDHHVLYKPEGFGYLIPSKENNQVMGVIFDSNIFPQRYPKNHIGFRVMMGGEHHPNVATEDPNIQKETAIKEVRHHFKISEKPKYTHIHIWKKAIPQYTHNYTEIKSSIQKNLNDWKNFHICANYWNGISVNDCITNAYQTAQASDLVFK